MTGLKKKYIIVKTRDEWNNIIDDHKRLNIKYIVCEPCGLTIKIIDEYGICYATSITGTDESYNDGAISSAFRSKCKYPIFNEGEYGKELYKAVGSFGLRDKVKWRDMEIKVGRSYYEPELAKKWHKCWSYDINSAYPYAMLQLMPDTSIEPLKNVELTKGYMGFYEDGTATLTEGVLVSYAFPLVESPFKEYIMYYYNKKCEATDKKEKAKYKDFLNHPTGYLCKHNIFLRNAIIFYSNEYITQFIDKNTIYCNIDSIVSLVPRYDIPIGNEIGQFKEEHANEDFKFVGPGMYQWGSKCHYRGIPSSCISDIENVNNWIQNAHKKVDKEGHIYE